MPTNCYKSGYEHGPWYELKCLRSVIDKKLLRGNAAKFEISLYKAWLKRPEYKKADIENIRKGIYNRLFTNETSKSGRNFKKKVIIHTSRIMKREKQGILI